ncbi:hypothetical protein IE53DRAFT_37491 [Violaceomyces palustris]|uniref:Uncharacterized protein n=1 Tax=Violaceomyces palustris TaxID=1673888 RepID=A0ACD0P135_9BASI|nr:hypothetical protein IE53DRAFT_37491 [Violaceomyces palustris]
MFVYTVQYIQCTVCTDRHIHVRTSVCVSRIFEITNPCVASLNFVPSSLAPHFTIQPTGANRERKVNYQPEGKTPALDRTLSPSPFDGRSQSSRNSDPSAILPPVLPIRHIHGLHTLLSRLESPLLPCHQSQHPPRALLFSSFPHSLPQLPHSSFGPPPPPFNFHLPTLSRGSTGDPTILPLYHQSNFLSKRVALVTRITKQFVTSNAADLEGRVDIL